MNLPNERTVEQFLLAISLSTFIVIIYIYIITIKLFVQILKQNCSTVRSFGLVTICEPPCLPISLVLKHNLASILMQKDMFCMQISLILQIYSPATILLLPAPCSLLPLAPCPLLLAPVLPLINQTFGNLSLCTSFS